MKKIAIVLIALYSAPAAADDFAAASLDNWHHWRGPMGNGVAPRGDPPVEWGETTNIRWKVEIPGEGHATPIVWSDQIFVLTAIGTERTTENPQGAHPDAKTKPPGNFFRFVVLSIDRETGGVRWLRTACDAVPHEGRQGTNTYASGSPTTDGRYLYASFGSRGLYCYDLNGELRWSRDLGDMRTRFGWGEAVTPAIHGDALIVNWDHEDDSFIVCLDARTGNVRWKVARDEPSSWATPLVVRYEDREQVIVNGTNRVRSYDLDSGAVVWECGGQTVNAIPCPVAADGVVFCMTGFRGHAAYAIPLDSTGDITGTDKVVWQYDRGTPYVPSPLLYGDRLFFTGSNNAVLTCLHAKTGEPVFRDERLAGLRSLYASPVGASDRIYFVGRDGNALVIKCGPTLEVLATNRLDDPIDASPAIVGKQMFLRGKAHLYCIEGDES